MFKDKVYFVTHNPSKIAKCYSLSVSRNIACLHLRRDKEAKKTNKYISNVVVFECTYHKCYTCIHQRTKFASADHSFNGPPL